MLQKTQIVNNRIILRDIEKNETIADTSIIDYSAATDTVWIRATSLQENISKQVCVLIITKDEVNCYEGRVRGIINSNQMGIDIYPSTGDSVRKHQRYDLLLTGEVQDICISNQWISLRRPIETQSLNISSDGILIKAPTDTTKLHNRFRLSLAADTEPLNLECKVMRIQNKNFKTEEYGCRIMNMVKNE